MNSLFDMRKIDFNLYIVSKTAAIFVFNTFQKVYCYYTTNNYNIRIRFE